MFYTLMRFICAAAAVLALFGGAALLLLDAAPHLFPHLAHAPVSSAPLLLIGLSYISLQPLTRPRAIEFLQRMMLGSAFILWGIDQLLPPSILATFMGDLVIVLYVIDLALIVREHLRTQDWETP